MTTENSNDTEKKTCPITDILENMRAQLHTEGRLSASIRPVAARVTRIITEVTLGRGNASLKELAGAVSELESVAPELAGPIAASLKKDKTEWENHIARNTCSAGTCFLPRSGSLSGRLPGTYRYSKHDGACGPRRFFKIAGSAVKRYPPTGFMRSGMSRSLRI